MRCAQGENFNFIGKFGFKKLATSFKIISVQGLFGIDVGRFEGLIGGGRKEARRNNPKNSTELRVEEGTGGGVDCKLATSFVERLF